jgi:mRNA interferase RelE/StbE
MIYDPSCGDDKKGDLAGVHVYKFKVLDKQFLLAYEYDKKLYICLPLLSMKISTGI